MICRYTIPADIVKVAGRETALVHGIGTLAAGMQQSVVFAYPYSPVMWISRRFCPTNFGEGVVGDDYLEGRVG